MVRHDQAARLAHGSGTPPRDVLVLSNDEPFRAVLADRLRAEGFRVGEASVKRRALQQAVAWHAFRSDPEALYAVVLDITQRSDEGFRVLDAIVRRDHTLPVLLLVRSFDGPLPPGRFGACMVIEGQLDPGKAVAAVVRLVAQREQALAAL